MRYLFFCAHQDDLEYYISNFMITVAENKANTVKIISATNGEYGTMDPALKGTKLLGEIRKEELRRAAKIQGIDDVGFLGHLDGHLEINKDVIQAFKKTIQEFNPDIIFAPECLYPYYPHRDHIRTGLAVYKVIKGMKKEARPRLFMYHSYINTHYFPMIHWRRQSKALREHISQYYLLMPMYPVRFFLGFYFGFRLPRKIRYHFLAEAFREVDFKADNRRKLGFWQYYIRRFIFMIRKFFNPLEIVKEEKKIFN